MILGDFFRFCPLYFLVFFLSHIAMNTNDRNGRMPVLEILLRTIDLEIRGEYQEITQIFAMLVLCEFLELSEGGFVRSGNTRNVRKQKKQTHSK